MIHPDVIGCDISKAHLDIFDSGLSLHHRIANTPAAIDAWLQALDGRTVYVVLEATGRYDRLLCAALEAANYPYSRVNPARARDFARATGQLAKTDAIDARLLARMGQTLPLATQAPGDLVRQALCRLHTRRDQLVAMRQQERTRLHEADQPFERQSLERHIDWLDGQIAEVEKACREQLRIHRDLAEQNGRLQSIPGIGPVTAMTLLTQMPELGQASSKAVAALAGLAPFNADSGTLRGQRHIRGGRKRVRDALYMAAFVAYRMKSPFQHFERQSLERHIDWLDGQIAEVEKACREQLRIHRDLAEQNGRLQSIPGIGPVTAMTLLTQMPELGQASSKAVAALAGLAPFNADSGTLRGQRHIRGGRKRVRDALYMAAFVAYRMKSPFQHYVKTLQDKAKPFKVMIIALARKILTIANALLRDKTMYQTA